MSVTPPPHRSGVASCDVWEVDKDPEVLVYGQQVGGCEYSLNLTEPNAKDRGGVGGK